MSWLLNDPMAFLMPTSLARFSERAVVRFMKLMQASSNTKQPMMPNNHTYVMRPPTFLPFLKSSYKCHLTHRMQKYPGLKFQFSFVYMLKF